MIFNSQKQSPELFCSQLAMQAWKKIESSKLANGKNIGTCPTVELKELDESLHGLAYPDHIELNINRLQSPDRDVFLLKTTLHEIAHVAEYRISGVMTHGPLWHALDDLIDGDGMQFQSYREPQNVLEDAFISFMAVTILIMMVLIGACLIIRFPVWWGYLIGYIVGGAGIIGLLAGLCELIKFIGNKITK